MSRRFNTDVLGDFRCGGAWTSMFKESGFETTFSIPHTTPLEVLPWIQTNSPQRARIIDR